MNSEKFQALDLHGDHHAKTDNATTPFVVTAKLVQRKISHVYSCAFNQYIPYSETQVAATCGDLSVYTYEVPLKENVLIPRLGFKISEKDDLYTLCWALDTVVNAHRIVTGGVGCVVYVIDAQSGRLMNRLESAGGSINELRTSPTNSNLVACATTDKTVRIYHIRNDSCLIVIGGLECHQDQVLSLDWSFDGGYLLSCSIDHTVMKFDLSAPHVKNHLYNACKALEEGKMNVLDPNEQLPQHNPYSGEMENSKKSDVPYLAKLSGMLGKPKGCTLPIYQPNALCYDLHEEYVDCVRCLPGSPYLMSKGCGTEKEISIWRFGAPKGVTERNPQFLETCCTKLMSLHIPDGEVWFTRFAVDPLRRYVAVGGSKGDLHVFKLSTKRHSSPLFSKEISPKDVRCVSFSANARMMLVVGDPDVVVRLDRVPSSVSNRDLAEALKK